MLHELADRDAQATAQNTLMEEMTGEEHSWNWEHAQDANDRIPKDEFQRFAHVAARPGRLVHHGLHHKK